MTAEWHLCKSGRSRFRHNQQQTGKNASGVIHTLYFIQRPINVVILRHPIFLNRRQFVNNG
ncbi:hypothetical protein DU258_14255 [Salmonella enterica subsp. enterica]|uniref:Uncharacterized protein n=1 Tax=Salmonella enterica subsp. enterica serovar Macclesfield str. S-1643 TaxID=1242107 RepID=A0A2C9P298_SALET|nr:hypothetical protein LFZ25_17665 [Salmonella enterica subsp. enterica serovar Macclesfield str. S-1643]EAA5486041.1 hypothetical protein [Salmonella enterica subsp. enterica serovar Kouka]EAC1132591.1 hypothetical protein [Salmonella enterica subsp. enterica serovar Kambole]EBS1108866.1 hypothetical protein [Salmonella enterica subsp. enterica serovar Eingedi]EBV2193804.1 hypothetical protein [Salmonella enterica subsp. enterica serovar Afula]ECH9260723.1 hypothetical protein [Salmonella en